MERRQALDVLPVRAEVTEHQLIERECACGMPTAFLELAREQIAGFIRSYLSTAAINALSFFNALVMLAEGEPWMPTAT